MVRKLYRRQHEKLRDFLNYDQLDKNRVAKAELGTTYSILFDKLYYDGKYDEIIVELKNMVPILSINYLKANTRKRLKLGPTEFTRQFWVVINENTK